MLATEDLELYRKYFQDITNGEKGINGFFYTDQISSEHVNKAGSNKFVVLNTVKNGAEKDKNPDKWLKGSLYLCQRTPQNEASQQKTIASFEKTIKQLRAKMIQDYGESTINLSFGKFKYRTATSKDLNQNELVGIKLEFQFPMPDKVEYDPDMWD